MQSDHNNEHFPIVGVGASAGGLEALRRFVAALPEAPGMAFVAVQHLDPQQPSAMVELLSSVAPFPIETVSDGGTIEANTMYVVPPGKQAVIIDGRFKLEPNGKAFNHPIDRFLGSLADAAGVRAVAVVLSGSGTDGALGTQAVRAAGGVTFAQDDSAKFHGMPHSAIASGVDYVLAPEAIAEELIALREHAYVRGQALPSTVSAADSPSGAGLPGLLRLLRTRKGVDFGEYKEPTLSRRIHRRMALHRLDTIDAYVQMLESDPAELDALFEDVLIKVTAFFRDEDVFAALRDQILPRLVRGRGDKVTLRVWIVGCATGEEPYSLAMTILELRSELPEDVSVKIFATDISEAALSFARQGVYSAERLSGVDPARRKRFFVPVAEGFQVRKQLRELCVFARHDVARDPPFSGLDLVSCRNVLIYLGTELQRRVLPILHYALRPGGVLLLGKAESAGRDDGLFEVLDKDHRFYLRRPATRSHLPTFPLMAQYATPPRSVPTPGESTESMERHADRIILARYAPAGVIIDTDLRVTQFRGDTAPYLANAPGAATLSILKLVRAELLPQLSAALAEVDKTGAETHREATAIPGQGGTMLVHLHVAPIVGGGRLGYVVLFETPAHEALRSEQTRAGLRAMAQAYGRRLTRAIRRRTHAAGSDLSDRSELDATQQRLHRLVDEHEAKTEELKAAHEEVLSSNEELQSTNEELQTAKEEVQATNEELTTVNEELEARNQLVARAGDDLQNLLSSTDIPIVMVSPDRRIRRFTPAAGRLLNLIAGDLGRPLAQINSDLDSGTFESLIEPVLDSLQVQEREVQNREGYWYRVSARPYRTSDDRVDGVVIAVADIDHLKRSERVLRETRDYAQSIVETVSEPLVVVDDRWAVVSANKAFCQAFAAPESDVVGQTLWRGGRQWDESEVRPWLERALHGEPEGESLELSSGPPAASRHWAVHARPVVRTGGPNLLLVAMQDVTVQREHERIEAQLTDSVLNAQSEEREHLARELHDETGQRLSALLMGLRSLEDRHQDAGIGAEIDDLRGQVRELIDGVGRLARGLHPSMLEELGLVGSIRDLADHFARTHDVDVHVDIDLEAQSGLDALPRTTALALFRVVQEALTNVGRHAEANTVSVDLRHDSVSVTARIHDDGRGFDLHSNEPSGLGLRLMERRVNQIGGRFEIGTAPGNGTVLQIEVPMQNATTAGPR